MKSRVQRADRNGTASVVSPNRRTREARALRVDWEPGAARTRTFDDWREYMAMASRVVGRFHDQFRLRHFDYVHPTRLQPGTPRRLKRPYPVSVAYSEWGAPDRPTIVCCGGVVNTAMRFNYLASDLASTHHVVCMDWVGRGQSGWMAAETDYSLATCVEQLRQLIAHVGTGPVTLLGSSLGGSAAIAFAAAHPGRVDRLILNDVGPFIPKGRRKRRAETLARHYVFRDPSDLMRRIGASQKNDGPIGDDIRFNLTFHQTRWSDADGGRVYRHDVRALQAYGRDARSSLRQWDAWERVRCPVLVIHGMLSDALLEPTIRRMRRRDAVTVMHVPDTGHTPVLADRNHIACIRDWLAGGDDFGEMFTVLHAPARERNPGTPIPFAPLHALR